MKPEITERQKAIAGFIESYCNKHGYSPSIRDIMAGFGIKSPNGVACHLKSMRNKGLVVWSESTARSIRVVVKKEVACPFCGKLASELQALPVK